MSKLLRIVVLAAVAAALPAALLAVNVDLTVSGVSGSPSNITLGSGNVTYTTSIFNASASAGTSPVLTMTIPASSTYVSSSATGTGSSCSESGGVVTCTWPSIGASNTFFATVIVTPTAGGTLTLSASVSGSDPDPTPANNSGSGSITCNSQIDLRVTGVSGSPGNITLGQGDATYTVSIFNGSTSQGTNPALTITLPANSTFVSASVTGTGGTCTPGTGTVTCNWPSIGASNTFFATIVVTPTAGGTLTLSASIAGDQPDPNNTNNSASGSVNVNDQIDLRVTGVSGSPSNVTLGTGNVTYTVSIFNGSTSQGTNPALTVTLPANSTFVSASVTGTGGTCTPGTGTVTCNWPSIAASNTFFATIVVTPTAGGTLTLSASIAGDQPDSNNTNNSASGSVNVNDQIDLRVTGVSGSPSNVTLGTGNVTYTVSIFNGSTSQGTNPVLTVTLPANSTFVSASVTGTGGTCTPGTGTVTCNWPSIGASNTFFATIVVTPTAGGTLTLSASIAGDQPDSNNANNSASGSVNVNDQIDLRVTGVSGSPSNITLGTGNVTYTVSIFNGSTSQGTNPALTVTLPANSTFVSASVTGTGGTCTPGTGTVTCNWPSIAASNTFFATIVVTPTAGGTLTLSASIAGDQPDSNNTNNSASGSVNVNDQIDLRVTGVSGSPGNITLGTGDVTYTVSTFNGSTSQGTNPVLTMTLPANSTFVSASVTGTGGTCTPGTGTVTCNWPSIAASNTFFATIVVTPTAGGTLTLSASIAGDQPDSNNANNSSNGSVNVNSQIDLNLSGLSGAPDPITFGAGNVTFTASIFNGSTSQGTNTVLTATLPSNSTYVSSSATGSGSCSQASGVVTCNWTSIPASNTFFVTIVVTPTIPGTLTLSASVTGAQPDPNSSNNSKSKTTAVTATSCTAIPSGAVAWYRAENNGVDSAGPNVATANGGASFATGEAGQAFSLNGTTAYVSAPDNASLHPASLTIEGWFKIVGTTGVRMLASKSFGSGVENSFFVFVAADGTLTGGVGDGISTDILASTTAPTTGVFHHFAYVYDSAGSAQALYLDGGLVNAATTSKVIAYDANPLLIGAQSDNSILNGFFSGLIDEVTIYSRALSQSEIQAVFGAGTFGKCFIAPSAPTIAGFTPTSGSTGSSVVITGTNFTSVSAVKFNGTSSVFTGNSSSQITATVPAAATTGTLSVVTGGGTATSAGTFTVFTDAHWINGSGGNWSTAANWSTGSVPTATNNVIIDASGTYTVTLDVTPAFNTLTVGGGATGTQTLSDASSRDLTFTNPGTIAANGVLALSSGKLLGSSALTVNGTVNWTGDSEIHNTVNLAGGATMNISGFGTRFVDGGTINNGGTINWSGANNLSVYDSGVINNLAAGLFSVTNDQQIFQHCCTAGQPFNNAGTFRKSVATGTTTIQSNGFSNSGTVDIQSGTFNPSSGGTSSGNFNATASGSFLFSSNIYALTTGATLTGAGNYQLTGGQLNVFAAVTVDHMTLSGGNLNINSGGSVSTSASGVIDWTADATLSGAGPLTISTAGTMNITGFGTRFNDGGTINNNGTVNWSGANNISVYDSGVINNLATGLFSVKNDQQIFQHCCTGGQPFNNVGTFRKSVATGTTTIQANGFNNSGTVDIQTGTFNPTSGGTSTAIFHTNAGGAFLFNNNTYTLNAGATLTGPGNYQLSGGQLAVNATGVSVDHLTMSGGLLNVAGTVSTSATGVVDWTADSTITGAGALTIGSGGTMNISGFGTRVIDGGTLNNDGTINWSGANNLSVVNSGVINNHAAGLFSVKNDQNVVQHCCAGGQAFNNAGTFRKSVATGTTAIQSNGFTNSGTVDIQTGTFNPSSGGTSTASFSVSSGATILFNSNTYTLAAGATLSGSGNVQLSGGTLAVNATGVTVDHLTLSGGTMNVAGSISTTASGVVDWNADSTLTGAGTLTIVSGGTMNISGFGTRFIDGGTLNNDGTIDWSGANNLSVFNSGVINNHSGALFGVKNDQIIFFHCCTAGQPFNNAGTFRKTVATGTTAIQGNGFSNSGTVDIQSGTFNPSSGGTSSAIFNATSAGTFLFTNNTYTLASGATLTGSGNFQLSGGTLAVNATGVTAGHLTLTGGTMNVAGSISTTPTGVVDWTNDSTLTGTGSLTIASGGTMNISGFGTRFIDGGTLNNAGTVNWSGPNNLSVFNSGVINNQSGGLFSVTNDQLVFFHCCFGGQPFNNAGTFRKSTATGTTTFQGIGFSNSGTLQPQSGVIAFNAAYSASGSPVYDFGIGSATTYGRLSFANPVGLTGALLAAPVSGFVPQGGQQFTIITFPSGSAVFSPKTLTFGSSPVRSFADTYPGSAVVLTASGPAITPPLSPDHGDTTGGTPVTITGSGFASGGSLAVTFGGNPATSVVRVNATTITCVTPAHTAGLVDVVVTNGDGQPSTAVNSFTFGTFTADVSIAGSAPATVANGGNVTYSTLVTNNGPSSASNVVATMTLPSNVTLNGSPTSSQGSCSGTTTITCSIGTLAAGNSATQTINLIATGVGTASMTASVAAIETDNVPANNSSITNVGVTGSSTMVVTTNANSGTGSLRQAILDANNAAVCPAPCTIAFNLPGGQLTIAPLTALPAVTAANVTIDGTTQPGFSGTPLVTLDGSSNPSPADGLQLSGGHDTVKGLSIVTFQGAAILLDTFGNDVVSGNYLGLHTDGSSAGQNAGDGVRVTSGNNTIGGTTAAARNVISGNFGSGVVLDGTAVTSNTVSGNYIGLNAAGTAAVPNLTDGIQILFGASSNTIGGTAAGARNVISGNANSGMFIAAGSATFCTNNVVTGNVIGTNAAGTATIANTAGIFFGQNTSSNIIGGLTAAEANTIDFTSGGGIVLLGSGNGNIILGNAIRDGAPGLSIDLENDGHTANDPGDGDAGANGLQNFPLFLDASMAGGTLTTHFNVDSASVPGTLGIRVELFRSDPLGVQLLKPLGSQCFAGNSLTAAAMTIPGAAISIGDNLAGTATSYTDAACTSPSDGTSEVSNAIAVTACTPPAATITPSGPTTFCTGGSVTLTASAGATFQWRNFGTPLVGATAQQLTVTNGGSYTVTVSNAAGCSATSSPTSVTVNSSVNVTISGPTTFCSGGNVTLTANPSGGSGSFTAFQWLLNGSPIGGATASTFNATAGGSYSVTVTDSGGCTGTSAPTTVTANAPPPAAISAPSSVCANSVVSASIVGGGVAGATYTWTVSNGTLQTGQGTPSITFNVTNATPVSLSVVATKNSCSANGSASIAVGPFVPTITSSGPTSFCPGGSVTLTASSGASFQWLLNGSPIGGATSQSFVASATGNYSVTVSTGAGCTGTSATTSVTQTTAPSPVITPSGPTTFCTGGNVTLTASAAATFQWSRNGVAINGATSQTFSATVSGSYTVAVTNGGGCTGTSPAVTVTVNPTPAVSISGPGSVCAGGSATLDAGAGFASYAWSTGATTQTITVSPASTTTYSVTVTSSGCSASASKSVAVTNGSSSTTVLTPSSVQSGSTGNVATVPAGPPGSTYSWTLTGAAITSGDGTPSITWTAGNGSFAVISVTVTTGSCSASGSATVTITAPPSCNTTAPAAIAPAAGATNVANPVNFSWSAAPNATSYDLWIASSGNTAAIATTTQSTSAMINLPSGPSTWFVTAHFNGDCPTLTSAPRDLTVAAAANCTHPAPQLISPSQNAAVNSPVTFSWTSVPQAVGYRLWLAIDGGPIQDAGATNGATSITVPLTGSSVSWHVDAIFPGCDPTSSASSNFTLATATGCASHAAPSLLAPPPNATVPSSIVDFQWTAVSGANGYRVWASINGADFAPLANTPAAVTTLHSTLTTGTIAWYVEALFDGCASMPSAQQSFTIPPAANCGNNAAAAPLSPANNASLNEGFVEFDWAAVPNAIGYELWLSIDGGAPSLAGTTTATFLKRTVGTGTIDWFVRTLFDRCPGIDSAHVHFTFTPPADCSVARSILTAPFDGAAVVFTPFDLRWSNVPGATQYKVWLASGPEAPKVIGTTAGLHLDNQTAPPGPVTWSVEALFDHCPSVRSTISSFTAVPAPQPCSTPAIPLPRAESTASTNVEYVIRWTPVGPTATTQYELQEATDASFTAPSSIITTTSESPFKHVNSGDAAVTYYYRVRAIGTCNGARSLFSLPLTVQVLPSNVVDPASANGSTPADNPQTTHYQIHLGVNTANKGAIAAATGDTFAASTNQPWLTVSPSSGTIPAEGTTLTVTAKTDGLPVGTSSGAVSVTFGSAAGSSNRRALDTRPASNTTVSVNLVQPVAPVAKNAPPPDALIIPAVAHAGGINSKFQSDVRVTNSSAQPMKYQITFMPTGDAGISQGKQTTLDVDPGRTVALDDVLESWFGSNGATGTLEIRPLNATTNTSTTTALPNGLANILTFAASRTFNTTSNGTFGQYIPAIPFSAFVGRGSDPTKSTILSLQQIAQSSAFRTNLGLVEGSGDPASVLVTVFGDNGQKLTEFTQDLKGGQHVQLNSILATKNVQVNDGRIEVKVVSPVGKVTAYASVLDNLTNDPLLVSPVSVNQTAAARYVLPGVADLNNGIANWQTDVRLFNPSTNIVKATLTFYSQNGGTPVSKDVSLAPGQVQTFDAALHQFFGLSNDGGALHISTTAPTPLIATARTYNQTANGTYGQFVPAVTANDAAALGTRPLQILQIEESDRYRTNVGFAEVTGKAAKIEITAVPSDSKVAASTQVDLAPNQFVQYTQLLKSMGLTNSSGAAYNARVTVKVISGQGRVTAYASVIDMLTNDPTFVPAQ